MAFTENNRNGLVYMTADTIQTAHAFTTRLGGVSTGVFASLNLGENRGDAPENVCENYAAVCRALGFSPDRLVFSRQVHGKAVRAVTAADSHPLYTPLPYEADGLVTNTPGVALVIFSADCVPVLLYDPVVGAAGACHAGWRGTALNIVGETVEKMRAQYGCRPADIRAAVGPAIGPCCFETDADVPAAMAALGGAARSFITSLGGERYRVDLKRINGALLAAAGVENVEISGECTMCSHEKYWSHRYTRGARGSQAAMIAL